MKVKNKLVKIGKRKMIIILLSVILVVMSLSLIIYYLMFVKKVDHQIIFVLKDGDSYEIEYGDKFIEPGVYVLVDNKREVSGINVDTSDLDISKLGEYKVKYSIVVDDVEYVTYRVIKVIDTVKPAIKLKGESKIELLLNKKYEEYNAEATDNYDGNITSKIVIDGKVDTSKEGEYKITYKVSDSSNNTSSIQRVVTVKKPKPIIQPNNSENKELKKNIKVSDYSNTVTLSKFTDSGFYVEGYKKNNNGFYKLKLSGSNNYTFDLINIGNSKYKGNINLSGVANGVYNVLIESNGEENLLNKLSPIDRIARAKIGNKIVTFIYDKDTVKIKIEDFYYQYDVIIDPGHGGSDVGASNEYIYEKEMNLIVSKYEKCRFENHGFKVHMTRNSDTYGNGLGDNSFTRLQRRAYEMGYYGVVSKIVYSNHHNSIGYGNYSGYEILIPGYLTSSQLSNEFSIVNKFNSIYHLNENHLRFYATDYDTEKKYSKLGGTVYSFKDNYAVNRIPYKLFNVKSIIYEGSYLSNKNDYNWYWNSKNWIRVSEAKLEVYINYLGGTYNSDNSSCVN